MYEENLKPLPEGDATQVFADVLAAIRSEVAAGAAATPQSITPQSVVQWANPKVQAVVGQACRRLLLPGSGIGGLENLDELTGLARRGHSCLICLNHRSNCDVPTLYALLRDQARLDLFDHILWVAGRKLDEDVGLTPLLVEGFNRIVVTPKSWLQKSLSAQEVHRASQVNRAAHRAMHTLRTQGWLFGLFPAGTRTRPHDQSTTQALEETDSYLKYFDFMLLAFIDGCTLPVTRNRDMTHETPRPDRMRYVLGPVARTDAWRTEAARRFPHLTQRASSARAIIEDINALRPADSADHEGGHATGTATV